MSERKTSSQKSAYPHNYGVDILRVWMCLEVVLCHFWTYTPTSNTFINIPLIILSDFRDFAVPCFMFVSFMLCARQLNDPNPAKHKLVERIKRLVIPIVFWSLGYFVVLNLLDLIHGRGLSLTIDDLASQLLFGHVYNTPMWFMNVLLWLTLTIILINRLLPRKHWLPAYYLITILSLAFCLSGLNYECFNGLRFEYRYTLGRYFEMMPLACIANILYLSGFRISTDGNSSRRYIILAVLCILGWLLRNPDWRIETFQYGLPSQYAFSIPFVLLVMSTPLDGISRLMGSIVKPLARYTLGIYCLHYAVGVRINGLCTEIGLPANTLTGCMVIFLVSYAICRIIALVPFRCVRRAVS